MRRTLLILGAILLASFGISHAKPNSTQEKPASTEPKISPEDVAKKNPVPPTPEGLAEARKLFGYNCAMCHGKVGEGSRGFLVLRTFALLPRRAREKRRRAKVRRTRKPRLPSEPSLTKKPERSQGESDERRPACVILTSNAFLEGVFRWPTRHNF